MLPAGTLICKASFCIWSFIKHPVQFGLNDLAEAVLSDSTLSAEARKIRFDFFPWKADKRGCSGVGAEAGFRALRKPIPARAEPGEVGGFEREREWPFPPRASIGPEGLRPRGPPGRALGNPRGCPDLPSAGGRMGLRSEAAEVPRSLPRAPPADTRVWTSAHSEPRGHSGPAGKGAVRRGKGGARAGSRRPRSLRLGSAWQSPPHCAAPDRGPCNRLCVFCRH